MSMGGKCFCGKALHYSDPAIRDMISGMVERLGEFVPVRVGSRTWLVSRHYIALHGLRAVDIPTLGFQEVTK